MVLKKTLKVEILKNQNASNSPSSILNTILAFKQISWGFWLTHYFSVPVVVTEWDITCIRFWTLSLGDGYWAVGWSLWTYSDTLPMKVLDILFEKEFYEKFQSVDFECFHYYAVNMKDFFLYNEEHLGHLCQAVELRGSKQCKC